MNHQNLKSWSLATQSSSTVLITGPTGSGKSRLAAEIHAASPRRDKPWITINLASLHEGTIESELFGHARGAFTGASTERVGRIAEAHGGTLFLDEVSELPVRLQARLLEFIQTQTLTPVGSNKSRKLDVRIIAATHRDLAKSIARGEFREDLYHRLNVIPLHLSALTERGEELDTLIHDCLSAVSAQLGKAVHRISRDVAAVFESHTWPGNIRELRNTLEYAALACRNGSIEVEDLPESLVARYRDLGDGRGTQYLTASALGVAELSLSLNYYEALTEFEREYFNRALRKFKGRINRTAREIGMSKATFIRRIRSHGLRVEEI